MKKLSISLATTILTSSIITLSGITDAAAKPAPHNFDGFHIGASVGIDNGHSNMSMSADNGIDRYATSGHKSQVGFLGGLNAGCDHFFDPNYFVGLEIGFDGSTLEGKEKINENRPDTAGNPNNLNMRLKAKKEWAISAALRAGMLISDNLLAYTTIGWVGADWKVKGTFFKQTFVTLGGGLGGSGGGTTESTNAFSTKADKFKSGLRVGLGMAKMLNENVQLGLETAYTWYGNIHKTKNNAFNSDSGIFFNNSPGGGGTGPVGVTTSDTGTFKFKLKPQTLEARVVLKWKF